MVENSVFFCGMHSVRWLSVAHRERNRKQMLTGNVHMGPRSQQTVHFKANITHLASQLHWKKTPSTQRPTTSLPTSPPTPGNALLAPRKPSSCRLVQTVTLIDHACQANGFAEGGARPGATSILEWSIRMACFFAHHLIAARAYHTVGPKDGQLSCMSCTVKASC